MYISTISTVSMETLVLSEISSIRYLSNGSVLISWKRLFISLGSIKHVTGILLPFLSVILFISNHHHTTRLICNVPTPRQKYEKFDVRRLSTNENTTIYCIE